MTPQEMKEAALKVARTEYDAVIVKLKEQAGKGELSCKFDKLSEGVRELLKADGYNVVFSDPMGFGGNWIVRVD